MSTKAVVIIAGTGIGLFALGRYFYVQKSLLEEIYVTPNGGNISNVSNDEVELAIKYLIVNPSDIEALCTNVKLDVTIGNVKVATIESNTPVVIKARLNGQPSKNQASAKVTIDKKNIEKQVFSNLMNIFQQKLTASFKGYATVKSSFLSINIPIEYDFNLGNF